ncbi:hypothetical protein ABZ799_01130 [Nocardiopsis dassonvillei]|uniref:hypothetical protein n=1 Tax=Nocardiopsis dassonvillei TaxID=2014 RepID=UPI0033CE1F29
MTTTAPAALQWDTATTIHYRPDPTETARRREASADPVTSWDALELLSALPIGEPVPEMSLTDNERRRVRHLPAGSVHRDGATITRLAVRPLAVEVAVVAGPPAKAFESATRFAPVCARAVSLDRLPEPKRSMYLSQASFYGVGVVVGGQELLAPVPYRPKRHTPAAWRFVERVYARTLP